MKDNRHEPAMPRITGPGAINYSGFNKAEYAALATGQPCSGTPWLDEMLAKARRERLAGQALAGLCAHYGFGELEKDAKNGYVQALADALIAELEGGDK